MSKFLLSLSFLLFSIISFSQDKVSVTTYKNVIGEWGEYSQKFIFQDNYNYEYITFTFRDTYIEANDFAKSIYRIVKEYPKVKKDSIEFITAECLDENNRKCLFTLAMNKTIGESYVMINYGKICYFYVIFYEKMKK
jgi:hypothetical protein